MRHGWLWAAVLIVVVMAGALSGCTREVTGSAATAPIRVTPDAAPSSAPSSGPAAGPGAPAPTPSGRPRSGLVADPLADECLLDAAAFGALVGTPVRPPEQGTVTRANGTTGSSCVATAGTEPVAMINVYTVRSGTPAEYVLAGRDGVRRTLAGVGEAAQVVDTEVGPTLQLASPAYLVTILVAARSPDPAPSDDAWRAAATAALARLPS